ncbi:HrpT family type III secretion system protein [Pseudomonas sp. ICMP 460]|uniref:HrpT family type III secretion system protein n=1 Tax=Pseudomonas sp. ICMP 460 TaxID=1718917 RepID=UPI000C078AC9|nr:HrpT family type III secretion system protein [Pseudomonas sp. ICMP 460]PHN31695.1 type III secretion protein [Pseudomonas sp. ICMP 460]
MKHRVLCVTLISAVMLVAGCTPTCKGDSCSRPQSSKNTMVIWWPPQTRVEPGPTGERADYQTISLEQ